MRYIFEYAYFQWKQKEIITVWEIKHKDKTFLTPITTFPHFPRIYYSWMCSPSGLLWLYSRESAFFLKSAYGMKCNRHHHELANYPNDRRNRNNNVCNWDFISIRKKQFLSRCSTQTLLTVYVFELTNVLLLYARDSLIAQCTQIIPFFFRFQVLNVSLASLLSFLSCENNR